MRIEVKDWTDDAACIRQPLVGKGTDQFPLWVEVRTQEGPGGEPIARLFVERQVSHQLDGGRMCAASIRLYCVISRLVIPCERPPVAQRAADTTNTFRILGNAT
jgi:hypothetical protein